MIAMCLLLRVFWFALFFVPSFFRYMNKCMEVTTRNVIPVRVALLCYGLGFYVMFFSLFSYLLPSSIHALTLLLVTFIACEKQRNTLSNLNCNVFKYFWNIKIPYSSQIVSVQEVHALLFICDTPYTGKQAIASQ